MISRKHQILTIAGLLTISAGIGVSLWGYHVGRLSLEAEKTLHAYYLVLDVLQVYLRENSGTWPMDWEDLAHVTPDERSSVFQWPDEIPKIRQRILIDFGLTREQVSAMDAAHFSAVQQIGPNYGPHESRISRVLETIRKHVTQPDQTIHEVQ